MQPTEVLENNEKINEAFMVRAILEKYDRSKILEVYFSRLDGRMPENIPGDSFDLYEIELNAIKNFLLGQHPHDSILQKVFRIMN